MLLSTADISSSSQTWVICFSGAQEELWPICVWSGIGHGEDSWSSVLQLEDFIFKLVSIDWLSSSFFLLFLSFGYFNSFLWRCLFHFFFLCLTFGSFFGFAISVPLASTTDPKTTCLPSSHPVLAVHKKNCDPFVFGLALAMERIPGPVCFNWKFSSSNLFP